MKTISDERLLHYIQMGDIYVDHTGNLQLKIAIPDYRTVDRLFARIRILLSNLEVETEFDPQTTLVHLPPSVGREHWQNRL